MNFKRKNRLNIPYITYILIIINVISFQLEIKQGGSQNTETLYRLGALVPAKVQEGEWWRLVTANFLHFGYIHLITNMMGLYFLGYFVEEKLGHVRYLILYLLSGIGTMSLYTWMAIEQGQVNQILLGASAAIMGLLGGAIALYLYAWLQEGSSLAAQRIVSLTFILACQFFLDFHKTQISSLSHLIGLLIGLILGILMTFYPVKK